MAPPRYRSGGGHTTRRRRRSNRVTRVTPSTTHGMRGCPRNSLPGRNALQTSSTECCRTGTTGSEIRHDPVVPVRQHSVDDVCKAFRPGSELRGHPRIPCVVDGVTRVTRLERRRRRVVGPPPDLYLGGAIFVGGLLLVQPLQR